MSAATKSAAERRHAAAAAHELRWEKIRCIDLEENLSLIDLFPKLLSPDKAQWSEISLLIAAASELRRRGQPVPVVTVSRKWFHKWLAREWADSISFLVSALVLGPVALFLLKHAGSDFTITRSGAYIAPNLLGVLFVIAGLLSGAFGLLLLLLIICSAIWTYLTVRAKLWRCRAFTTLERNSRERLRSRTKIAIAIAFAVVLGIVLAHRGARKAGPTWTDLANLARVAQGAPSGYPVIRGKLAIIQAGRFFVPDLGGWDASRSAWFRASDPNITYLLTDTPAEAETVALIDTRLEGSREYSDGSDVHRYTVEVRIVGLNCRCVIDKRTFPAPDFPTLISKSRAYVIPAISSYFRHALKEPGRRGSKWYAASLEYLTIALMPVIVLVICISKAIGTKRHAEKAPPAKYEPPTSQRTLF